MTTATLTAHPFELAKKAGREPFKVKDLSLAEWGRKEIRLAEFEMPGLMSIRAENKGPLPLKGAKIHGPPPHNIPNSDPRGHPPRTRAHVRPGPRPHPPPPGGRGGGGSGETVCRLGRRRGPVWRSVRPDRP